MTSTKIVHVTVTYKENASGVTATYVLPTPTLREAQFWQAKTKNPSAADLKEWLLKSGAKLDCSDGPAYIKRTEDRTEEKHYRDGKLHREHGPALIERKTDGSSREIYYRNDQFHREDGPAIIEHTVGGYIREEYYREGRHDRQDGPAVIEIRRDGSGCAIFYEKGNFIKKEPLAPLTVIPGVSIRKTPSAPTP
jgi:hypothetical protein